MDLPLTGSCQCGQVQYRVIEAPTLTVVCHCLECQKQSAAAFGITMVVPRQGFELVLGELKTWKRPAHSGDTVSCHFCPDCGNRIYHDSPGQPDVVRLKPGTLDDSSVVVPEVHVWTKRAQPWIVIPDGMPQFETQPDLNELSKGLAHFKS